jgi:lipoprotein-anchoring transpeptidase ErfK/SrfK
MRRKWHHWSGGAIAVVVVAVLCAGIAVTVAGAARSSSDHSKADDHPKGPTVAEQRATLQNAVTFQPLNNATNVPLDEHIAVAANQGHVIGVDVSGGQGVTGGIDVMAKHWISTTAGLEPNTTYTVNATISGADGVVAHATSTFHTMAMPGPGVSATIFPDDNLSVGIAQPIVIRFDHDISDPNAQASVLAHFNVQESTPVTVGWHWFSDTELHFRPETYWPPGEHITVTADLDGWNAGNGNWGAGQLSSQFSIGDAHVSIANVATHEMSVSDNGHVIAVYPISAGREDLPTMNGIHIVMDRESVVRMISSTNGIPVNSPDGYDELVYDDVHISDSGEYVHAAPWSVASQGNTNVSHGCINVSPTNAAAFMAFSRVGDVVEVVGSSRPPAPGDHGVMDWDTPWSEWTPASSSATGHAATGAPAGHRV